MTDNELARIGALNFHEWNFQFEKRVKIHWMILEWEVLKIIIKIRLSFEWSVECGALTLENSEAS